ncbi:uncharacterized protein BP5553_00867 [Venustampulla echinocandica]|uniref:Uncharacterized protein n=1 Tax=Venustampulla echinocandica TaxID=2656787 RepID=A0A370TZH2_9HELO|nr:uncharacterized protein BP5553_00867 [Venustampulla echinocandica]RDL40888.1 hypothetical protein BP5553_00867 [Venustampulla echinocandica]
MKLTSIISALPLFTAFAYAADSKLDVASVISEFYPTKTPSVEAAVSTSLASALHSVQASWFDSPAQTSAYKAIYSAAPSSLKSSLASSGYRYAQITTQEWYTKDVPKAQQTDLAKEDEALKSAARKILGTSTSTGGAVQRTGMAVAGVVGAVGAVLAAL